MYLLDELIRIFFTKHWIILICPSSNLTEIPSKTMDLPRFKSIGKKRALMSELSEGRLDLGSWGHDGRNDNCDKTQYCDQRD